MLALASAVPLTTTPAAYSAALTILSVATVWMTGAVGAAVSMLTLRIPALLALPAASLAMALMLLLLSVGTSLAAKLALQAPVMSACTVLTAVPQVASTVALDSVVPLTTTPAAFSVALTMSLPATVWITGTVGAVASILTARITATLALPAASVAVAVMLPPSGMVLLAKVLLHVPPVAVTVCVVSPQVTATLEPASAVPLTATPASFSAALTMSLPDTMLMVGASGVAVSMLTVRVPAAPVLPAASVATAEMLPLAGTSALAKVLLQLPLPSAVTFWELVPQVTTTLALASALPLTSTPAAFSSALTVLSVATALITGAVGAALSMLTLRVPAALVLLAMSLAVTLMLLVPSAGSSPLVKLALQAPVMSACTVLMVVPQVAITVALDSAMPLTTTPAAFSTALMMSLLAIASTSGALGAVLSLRPGVLMVTARVPAALALPAASCAMATTVEAPSAGTSAGEKFALQVPSLAAVMLLTALFQ